MKKSEKFVIYATLVLSLLLFFWSLYFIADIEGAFGRTWENGPFVWRVYTVGAATSFLLASLQLPFKRRTGRWFALPGLVAVSASHVYGLTSATDTWWIFVNSSAVAFSAVAVFFLFVVAPRYERRRP